MDLLFTHRNLEDLFRIVPSSARRNCLALSHLVSNSASFLPTAKMGHSSLAAMKLIL